MRMYDLILKKKQGGELSTDEIRYMIEGFTEGSIPDYQMSAMTMAICFRGMTPRETVDLTLAMRDSGDVLDLSGIKGVKVDKHSTGGVGDKTSLALTPIIAALGVPVAKMSGRGLGHTGGTIDKLECFDGFTTALSEEQFAGNVNTIGIAIAGQTANLAPADKKLYALRDVTATVDQMSLIASSIMSKKLASGSDAIVLDVKTGNGAFMKKLEDSRALAKEMVSIGTMAGKKTVAVITDMDQPLGRAVGNSLEVREAIDTLRGEGPADFKEVVFALGSQMLMLAGRAADEKEARALMEGVIEDGSALDKFAQFVRAQGGDAAPVYDTSLLPVAGKTLEVTAKESGYVHRILAEDIGIACMTLGGGRETKESAIDLSVGIILEKKNGDAVEMMIKVKEPLPEEYPLFHEGLILYTYLHLAADKPQTDALLGAKVKGVAYETLIERNGSIPLLAPMSQIAGRLSIQEGAKYLEKRFGGEGVLLAGVPGTPKANIVILGGGSVGTNACKIAVGMGANVTIMDINLQRLAYLDDIFGARIQTLVSNDANIEKAVKEADLVIGCVLIPGKSAPKIFKKKYLKEMKPGAVFVDVAVDQGGCGETTKVTYHDDPIFIEDGVVHYCVGNMPGAVPRTSTIALTNATLSYGLQIAGKGLEQACKDNEVIYSAINTYDGKLTCKNVADSFECYEYTDIKSVC